MEPHDLIISHVLTGSLKTDLPELYLLREVVENDDSHLKDSAFDHTLRVSQLLQWLLENTRNGLRAYFSEIIFLRTRKELLLTAALLHDIGKKQCYVKEGNRSSCPDHEQVGAALAAPILGRFDFPEEERAYICELIRRHGETYSLFSSGGKLDEKRRDAFASRYPGIYRELLLLLLADIMGSQLRYHQMFRFEQMVTALTGEIKRWES